jgi:hypothetical protein
VYLVFRHDHRTGEYSAHPYVPRDTAEACSVARELSRDFPGSLVYVQPIGVGRYVSCFHNGDQCR